MTFNSVTINKTDNSVTPTKYPTIGAQWASTGANPTASPRKAAKNKVILP